jgi:hypothetical protein
LLPLSPGTLLRASPSTLEWIAVWLAHGLQLFARDLQMFFNSPFPTKRLLARVGIDLRAVVRYALKGYQSFRAENREHLREELV